MTGNITIGSPVFNHATSEFGIFQERLEQFFIANEIAEEERKKAVLINSLDEETYKLVRDICFPESPHEKSYTRLMKTIGDHFRPVKSYFYQRLNFYSAKKRPQETIAAWAARVKRLAAGCGFGGELEVVMRDVFVLGICEPKIIERLFEEDPTNGTNNFFKMVKVAQAKESALTERSSLPKPENSEVYYQKSTRHEQTKNVYHKTRATSTPNSTKSASNTEKCSVCGRKNHVAVKCKYRSCVCYKCGVKGHLAPMCNNKSSHRFLESNCNSPSTDNQEGEGVVYNSPSTDNLEDDQIFNLGSLEMDDKGNVKPIFVKLIIDNIPFNFEIDSGVAHCTMSEKLYRKHFRNQYLYSNDLAFHDYVGLTFQPLGFVKLNVKFEDNNYTLKIYIIRNGGPPLLGRNAMNMLKLGITKTANINNIATNAIQTTETLAVLCSKYSEIFENTLGTFNKSKIDLKVKEGTTPKFFKPRPVPFALKPKVEAEIDRLVANKVLVPVDYSDWGTPIVSVLKANGKIRICGDFKVTVNPHIIEQKYPLPRIEYLFNQLRGGNKFSKIDLSEAYQQILLEEQSRKLVTISTHKGLFAYTRLPYGITSAPAIFQNIMEKLFISPGVGCFLDDIIITGKDDKEHLDRLENVFRGANRW